MSEQILALTVVLAALLVLAGWWFVLRRAGRRIVAQARRQATRVLEEADQAVAARHREVEIQVKEKLLQARSEFESASRQRRSELESLERRLTQKEDSLDKRADELARRERDTAQLEREQVGRDKALGQRERELAELMAEERAKLEQIAGLTAQQAREELLRVMESEARMEAAHLVKRLEDEARETAHKKAQMIISLAVQRSASDYVSETTVSVVVLPNDEMKGRIIGREGRNIRAIEAATGVDLIVDDTPEAVILSGFDPFRREIARVSLERLIADGRIHPARIEEVVERTRSEFEQQIVQEGEAALLELNIPDMDHELVKLLGRLRYRTSYGQNVLQHSKEVAFLAGVMAAELRADVHVARRAGLVHDIGKAVDREMDGTHLEIGIDL
ncbi:MAG TPA: ribonuclease Y, partial [Thermoanaerobaculia bacterium]|nr:ribonuclease Y [Thermoanaerobaculia bacterium]